MPMPAFDMEPTSTSPPEGHPAPPSQDDVAGGAPPASPEAAATKPLNGGTAPAKPPPASLTSITGKINPAPSAKAGDLTRLFALARHEATSAPVEPLPAAEPLLTPPVPALLEDKAEPQPMPIELAVAEGPPPLETAPELPLIEPMELAEPLLLSERAVDEPAEAEAEPEAELLTLPPIPADVMADPAEPVPAILSPAHDAWASLEIPVPAPDVVEAPAAPAPAPEPARAPEWGAVTALRTTPAAPKFSELADYWRSLRNGDDHPAAEAIDRDFVTERWPGALLIAYTPASQDPRGEPRPGRVTRLGTACAETQNAVDAGSHSTEWMLEAARAALINDEPVEEQQRLATLTGEASFRMVALPLGPSNGQANAVLCALLPGPGAPRFGKRRIWL